MTSGKRFTPNIFFAPLIAAIIALPTSNTHAAINIRTVAMSGTQVPGAEPGVTFASFHPSSIVLNKRGQTAFLASLAPSQDVDDTNKRGIWSEGSGSLELVARTGSQAQGTEQGTVFYEFEPRIHLNNLGQAAFAGELTGPSVNNNRQGVWSQGTGGLSLVARTGDHAPGTEPGVVFDTLHDSIIFNDAGQTAISGQLYGSGISYDQGLWLTDNDSLTLVARTGSPTPDTTPGSVYTSMSYVNLQHAANQIVILGQFEGSEAGGEYGAGIWMGEVDSLSLAIRAGDPAPGAAPGDVFGSFWGSVASSDNGWIAVNVGLIGSGPSSSIFRGIWSSNGESTNLIARTGNPAPGTEPGTLFDYFGSILGGRTIPVVNNAGQVAFSNTIFGPDIDSTNNHGIWSGTSVETLKLIVRAGDTVPGADPGIVFSNSLINPQLNSSGQIVFTARLTGPGIDSTNNTGIWVAEPNGALRLIIQEGHLFDVNTDPLIEDLRTISFVEFATGHSDRNSRQIFNDAGQLALYLGFTDGTTGIFAAALGLPGDLNGDGFVGINDLNLVLANWNQNVPPANPLADPSGDGFVGIDDLNAVLGNWNTGTPPSDQITSNTAPNVPEPASLLILTSLLGLQLRRV